MKKYTFPLLILIVITIAGIYIVKTLTKNKTINNENIIHETRQLLISQGKLSNKSTLSDVVNYVTGPLFDKPVNKPFIYFCKNYFLFQYAGGESHKLEYYSTTFRKIDACNATFEIMTGQGYPASCKVSSECIPIREYETVKNFKQ